MTIHASGAVVAFVVSYVLIATERVHRVAAALGGAAVMVLVGASGAKAAFFDERTGIDWNVIFLLFGMMIIVGVLRQTGVFEYLAIWAAKRARAKPFRVMVVLVVVTAVASALLDNVTTVLLMAPMTLMVCDLLGVDPVPYLIAEALSSNIGGTATLVGDPPNIIIAGRAGLSFNEFIVHLTPIIVILTGILVLLCRVMFRRTFVADPERTARVMALDEGSTIRDAPLLRRCLVVLSLVVVGFFTGQVTGLEPSVVALLGAGLLVALSGLSSGTYLADVEWESLAFFAGLFVMVGALVHTGVIERVGAAATSAMGDRYLLGAGGLLFGSAALSAVVDNIPFVATMAPLVHDLAALGDGGSQAGSLWWALSLGANLGGNATAVGASANVVIIGIARRHGHPVSFWRFTRYGIVVAAVTVAVSWLYLWLRYFVL